ncbi:MAG: hypothetical protein J6U53_02895 [Tidjanibacter sp.]|nr:hypothetical protein [Tidjanibacter sp.]
MKRLIFSVLVAISSIFAYAQVSDRMTWVEGRDGYVVTLPKVVVYEIPNNPNGYSIWAISSDKIRGVISVDDFKAKKLKKSQTLLVRGYANRTKSLGYDTYIVEYKDKRYLLPCESVDGTALIESVNRALKKEYDSMTMELEQTQRELDSLVTTHTKKCEERLAYYNELQERLPVAIDSVKNKAKADYEALKQSEIDRWYSTLPKSTKSAYAKLSISDAILSSPNSASGCDYTFVYTNKSKKTIKYLYWEGNFYNAVNDPVYCEIRGYGSFRGQDTGPVVSGESGGGVWDCVIYNWSADYVKLSSVSIIYMDGSTATIGAADIKRLLTEPEGATWYEEQQVVENASKSYERQLVECNGEVRTWQYRLNYLQAGNFRYGGYENGEYEEIFEKISRLYNKSNTLKDRLSKFEAKNLLK